MDGIAFFKFALQTLQSAGDSLPAAWSELSRPVAALALTAVWQGATVALGLALCLRLAPRSPAKHRFALWAAGFGALVSLQILPLAAYLIPVRLKVAADSAFPAVSSAAASHPWLQLQLNAEWSLLIASLWLAASLYRAGDLAVHSLHLRKLWQSATPVEIDPASLPRSLSRISGRRLQICTTSELERPSVIGFFAPRILIPDWLFSRLTPGELDQIILHETEHLRRRDDWTNLLQKLCLVLFPLNPGLAWIERRLCREREMACDDGVIGITRAPRAYAACLASLAERGLQRRAGALSLGAWHARPELVRRVHSILRRKHALSPVAARAVVAAVGCVLLAGAIALAHCPRLIAFVPAHCAIPTHNSSADQAPASSTPELAALKGHDFSHADNNPKSLRASAPERTAANLKTPQELAALKGHDFSRADNNPTSSRASAREGNSRAAHGSAASQPASLDADNILPAVPVVAPAHQSAFIVMSAWESVEVANPESRNAAGNRSAQSGAISVSGQVNGKTAQQLTPRISVTRMYLKIYAAGGRESAWLVIQL